MQPYQEEYIANLKDIAVLAACKNQDCSSFETYRETLLKNRKLIEARINRNIELLRDSVFSLYDRLFEASPEELAELEEFARMLADASS